jgi:hypothetical protein
MVKTRLSGINIIIKTMSSIKRYIFHETIISFFFVLFLVVTLVCYQSCKHDGKIKQTNHIVDGQKVIIIEYKNHEYIRFGNNEDMWGTHFPDCRFCK